MLYTIKDVSDRLDELESERFVGVSVDTRYIGVAVVSDIKEQIRRYGSVSNNRRIKKIFLSGVTYYVKIGITLTPCTLEELWMNRNKVWRTEEEPKAEEPAVKYDEDTGMLHFNDVDTCETTGDSEVRATRSKEKSDRMKQELGFLGRIKRWLRGDIGYKR